MSVATPGKAQPHVGPIWMGVMDRAAKLYRLYAELTVVKRALEDFAALRPNPRQWTQEEVARHEQLVKRGNDIRAEIAELESIHAHRRH